MIDRMGLQKIENHGVRNHELTIDRLGPSGQTTHQHAQIHVRGWSDDGKANAVLAPPAGASRNLLDFCHGEVGEVLISPHSRLREDHRPGGEIDTGGERRRREHGVQTTPPHQLLNGDLPGRQMACMMRRHAVCRDHLPQRMVFDTRVCPDQLVQHPRDLLLAIPRYHVHSVLEGLERLIARAPRRQEHNGRRQGFLPQYCDQMDRMD